MNHRDLIALEWLAIVWALIFAIAIHAVFFGALLGNVRWQHIGEVGSVISGVVVAIICRKLYLDS